MIIYSKNLKPLIIASLATFIYLAGCSNTTPQQPNAAEEREFESMILGRPLPTATNIVNSITSEAGFTKDGNFYRVDKPFKVFGLPAEYVGILGVELLMGPNATVKASPRTVAQQVRSRYAIILERQGSGYFKVMATNVTVYILPHPTLGSRTMIIGSYVGP